MSLQIADAWRRVAREAHSAARRLGGNSPRGALNRSYYAIFAWTHAELIATGLKPRKGYGTWSHENLPTMVETYMPTKRNKLRIRTWAQALRKTRKLREFGDYYPRHAIGEIEVVSSLKETRRVLDFSA